MCWPLGPVCGNSCTEFIPASFKQLSKVTPEKYFRQNMAWSQKIFNTEQHRQVYLGFLVSSTVTLWLPMTAHCKASAGTERQAQAATLEEVWFCRRCSCQYVAGIPPSPERTLSHALILLLHLQTNQDFKAS